MNNIIIIIPILVILFFLLVLKRVENFETTLPDHSPKLLSLNQLERELSENILEQTNSSNNIGNTMSNGGFKNTDLERVARAVAKEYCPVGPNYDPTQYVKKTKLKDNCPKVPNLEDYIHKSAQQPQQKCPACICPDIDLHTPKSTGSNSMCLNLLDRCKNNDEFKTSMKNKCKQFYPCQGCATQPNYEDIKNNLMSELKCPGPEPCPVYKDVIPLIMALIDNKTDKNRRILKYIKDLIDGKVTKTTRQPITTDRNKARTTARTTARTKSRTTDRNKARTTDRTTGRTTDRNKARTTARTTLSEISINNNNHYKQTNVTIPPADINNLAQSQRITPERRAENIHYNGESDDNEGGNDVLYPASNSDICKSAPLKLK